MSKRKLFPTKYFILRMDRCEHCPDGKVNGKMRKDYTFERVPCPKCKGTRVIEEYCDANEWLCANLDLMGVERR